VIEGEGFIIVAEALQRWPVLSATPSRLEAPYQRVIDAMRLLNERPHSVGPRDLAALIRQILRYETRRRRADQYLAVPATPGWPTSRQWQEASCSAQAAADHFVIRAASWEPAWADGYDVFDAANTAARRRPDDRVDGDPFLADVLGPDFTRYSSPGQRQAIRTVLCAADGATIVVNLPTGSGKSAVAIAPALLQSRSGGVTIVVVPTTSLALDQERAVRAHLVDAEPQVQHPVRFSYYGGMPEEERVAVRAGIRDGTQRIVFTSPESLNGSLAVSVSAAARSGHLRYFVIDEAHTVSSWGAEFRPEFQALSGFRQVLLRLATQAGHRPPKTLLMSATLTEDAMNTLATLFSNPGPIEYAASVVVRPEPEYWVHRCNSPEDRQEILLDTVRHLPRPAIVYTSTREDARLVADALRSDGTARIGVVTGETSAEERRKTIEGWRGLSPNGSPKDSAVTELDIVVGTSAFGLGVDQSDVRAVVHACLPESVDRYYQEVGRGGRDGRTTAALLLYTSSDRAIAESLSATKVIGLELGLERWTAMLDGAESLGEDKFRVSLDSLRTQLTDPNRQNFAWNLRTLSLMMRAGLLRLDAEPPPPGGQLDDDEKAKAEFEQYFTTAVVELIHPQHADPSRWSRDVDPARRATIEASRRGLSLMFDLLSGSSDFANIFQSAYSIDAQSALGTLGETMAKSGCGGCPDCRAHQRNPYASHVGAPDPVRKPRMFASPTLASLTDGLSCPLLITFDPQPVRRRRRWRAFDEVVTALVRHGVRLISAPTNLLEKPAVQGAHLAIADGFLFLEPNPASIFAPKVASLIVHDPLQESPVLPLGYFSAPSQAYPRILLVPDDARDPERPDQLVVDTRYPNMDVDTLLAKL
jgi:ATP-dependent DNA helicase RecQ